MTAEITYREKMADLLGRLRVEMNGAVSDAMRVRGIRCPVNYGVSVPTIKKIAGDYAPDHKLAALLWRQQVRELKIAALHIADPAAVTAGELDFWAEGVVNTEVAEHAALALFSKTPCVGTILDRWLAPGNDLLIYTALMTGAASLAGNEPGWDWEKVIDKMMQEKILSSEQGYVWRGAATLLGRIASRIPGSGERIGEVIEQAKSASLPSADYLAGELEWLL